MSKKDITLTEFSEIFEKDTRPKIPLKEMSANMKGISGLLWLASIILLVVSLVQHEFTTLFWIFLLTYSMLYLKSNIAQCFKKTYILKSLLYLPLLFIPKFVCEQLLARANIWWLNIGISANFLFGSAISQTATSWISFFITMGILILLFFPCNYYEEYHFRKRWYLVGIWALLHLFLGFSNFSIGEFFVLCGLGIGFKLIYDKHGIQVSYPTHVFVNIMTVFMAVVIILISV
jgi:hypothetical protein